MLQRVQELDRVTEAVLPVALNRKVGIGTEHPSNGVHALHDAVDITKCELVGVGVVTGFREVWIRCRWYTVTLHLPGRESIPVVGKFLLHLPRPGGRLAGVLVRHL
jgi:hypothetical protein